MQLGSSNLNTKITGASPTTVERYLVESPHTPGDCRKIVKNVYAQGYLNNCDWGCEAGVHVAWVIIEAENDKQALWVVPPILRENARAIRLVKFDQQTVEKWEDVSQASAGN